jgi:hypothetical protein
MLGDLAKRRFKLSLNSFGMWRDLVRQPPVKENHWEQYLLLSACRDPIPVSLHEDALLPYIGAQGLLELRQMQIESQHFKQQLNEARSHLESLLAIGKPMLHRHLDQPFSHDGGSAWIAQLTDLVDSADNQFNPYRSQLLVLEENRLLGPPHALHEHIRATGRGSYSHWMNALHFSTADNSDPNKNGRRYAILIINHLT